MPPEANTVSHCFLLKVTFPFSLGCARGRCCKFKPQWCPLEQQESPAEKQVSEWIHWKCDWPFCSKSYASRVSRMYKCDHSLVNPVRKYGIRCLDLKRESFDTIYKKHASHWGKHAACAAVVVSRTPGVARFWRLLLKLCISSLISCEFQSHVHYCRDYVHGTTSIKTRQNQQLVYMSLSYLALQGQVFLILPWLFSRDHKMDFEPKHTYEKSFLFLESKSTFLHVITN